MDSGIGRIPHDPTVAPPAVRPVGPRRREHPPEEEGSFEDEFERDEHAKDDRGRRGSTEEREGHGEARPRPDADPDVGGQLDLTV